jgi:hypothetical protein
MGGHFAATDSFRTRLATLSEGLSRRRKAGADNGDEKAEEGTKTYAMTAAWDETAGSLNFL